MEVTDIADNAPTGALNEQKDSPDAKAPYTPLESVDSADADGFRNDNDLERVATDERPAMTDAPSRKVEITQADKNAYLDAIVKGTRYTSKASLFGGRVNVKFRSRSLEETAAILSYINHEGAAGSFRTRADVQNASLTALLVAQVAEIDGVSYGEMKKPLLYVETVDGVDEPAWVKDLEIWRRKPEALVAALGDALVEFEAKYWEMTRAAKDENFWNPDGSTGK